MRCPTCSQRSDLVTTQLEPHLGAHPCTRAYLGVHEAVRARRPAP